MKLLLTRDVSKLGIVGDVVNVRLGYARNFLLPRQLATEPSDEMIASLAEKRKQAELEMAQLRAARKTMIEKLEGHEITLERSCNDQGILYGGVTQADIAEALPLVPLAPAGRPSGPSQFVSPTKVLIKSTFPGAPAAPAPSTNVRPAASIK